MSFLSGLKAFGTDIEKAFAWFGSPSGKTVVAAGEAVVETVVPASVPIVGLFNTWAAKAFNIESIAVAAGQSSGTGVQKAALVESAIAPDVIQYATEAGLPARTAAQITAANNAAIAFIKAMTDPPGGELMKAALRKIAKKAGAIAVMPIRIIAAIVFTQGGGSE